MQELALSEGALPRHLHTSLFTISADQRMLTNRSSLQKVTANQFLSNKSLFLGIYLSRHICYLSGLLNVSRR